MSIGGNSVICSLEQQTRGVLYTNCVILPKRRVVGDSLLFVVGFLCPEFGVKVVCFEFFEKAGRGQLQGRTPQIAFIICFTYIVIEIAIRCTVISTVHYSCTIFITCNSSYTNAMINNFKWTITADSCRIILSLHVSCKKALGNYSVLSGIAADSTCCIPFYRSGKGAAINFAHRQVSANSSCLGIRSRNNHSVGSQKHYFTAFCDLTIYVTYPAKQAQTITCHIDMAYRMSVSTEFSCVRSSWISNGTELYSAHIYIVLQDVVSAPFCIIPSDGYEFLRRGDQGIDIPVVAIRCNIVINRYGSSLHLSDLCHLCQIDVSPFGCTKSTSCTCSHCSVGIDTALIPDCRIQALRKCTAKLAGSQGNHLIACSFSHPGIIQITVVIAVADKVHIIRIRASSYATNIFAIPCNLTTIQAITDVIPIR